MSCAPKLQLLQWNNKRRRKENIYLYIEFVIWHFRHCTQLTRDQWNLKGRWLSQSWPVIGLLLACHLECKSEDSMQCSRALRIPSARNSRRRFWWFIGEQMLNCLLKPDLIIYLFLGDFPHFFTGIEVTKILLCKVQLQWWWLAYHHPLPRWRKCTNSRFIHISFYKHMLRKKLESPESALHFPATEHDWMSTAWNAEHLHSLFLH